MNITDEAIESAARALCDLAEDDWTHGANGAYEDQARAALQAAGPYLRKE